MPTARSTSATRSTRFSRTSWSSPGRCQASTRPTSRAGIATACRSNSRSRRSTARSARSSTRRSSARPAANYARAQVDSQRRDFRRLGVLGDWDHPYLTLDPAFEAEQVRGFARIIDNGHVQRGYKPVHWCLDCGSALAEAEVEYLDKTSSAIDVRFDVVDPADFYRRLRAPGCHARPAGDCPSGPRRPGRCRPTRRWPWVRNWTTCWSRRPWPGGANAWCWLRTSPRPRWRATARHRSSGWLDFSGDGIARADAAASVLRAPGAGDSRRLRDAGCGHRRRAHRARPWPG